MKYFVEVKITPSSDILLELDDANSPNTVHDFIEKLPFTVNLNVWGDEIYTSKSPVSQSEENAKSTVCLNDVDIGQLARRYAYFMVRRRWENLGKSLLHHLST